MIYLSLSCIVDFLVIVWHCWCLWRSVRSKWNLPSVGVVGTFAKNDEMHVHIANVCALWWDHLLSYQVAPKVIVQSISNLIFWTFKSGVVRNCSHSDALQLLQDLLYDSQILVASSQFETRRLRALRGSWSKNYWCTESQIKLSNIGYFCFVCPNRKSYKLPTATTIAKLVRIIQAPKGLQFWATEGMALALIYHITGLLYVNLWKVWI